jgi:hypothetical protein
MRSLAVFLLGAVLAAGVGAVPARIFALNLFALPVDVQWGDPGVYTANGLFSRMVAKGMLIDPDVPRAVLFKRAGQGAWSLAKGTDGKSASVALGSGETGVLVVRANGNGELVKVLAPSTTAPKILFVNAARGPAAQFRLGVAADGQEPGFRDFVDAVPGVQTLTWSWPTMPPGTDAYLASSAQPGQPGTTTLTEGHWYIAVISGSNGTVTDVTP